jgi:cytochrome P450
MPRICYFRKYPITWATSRITQEDMEIAGHHIPENVRLLILLIGTARQIKYK